MANDAPGGEIAGGECEGVVVGVGCGDRELQQLAFVDRLVADGCEHGRLVELENAKGFRVRKISSDPFVSFGTRL